MVKKIIVLFVVLLVFVVGMVAWGVSAPSTQAQSNLKAVTGWAWSSNIGWIKFAPTSSASDVQYNSSTGFLSGYAWSSNIGWINFGASGGPEAPTHAAQLPLADADGAMTGWAKAIAGDVPNNDGWDGWIKMSGGWADGVRRDNDKLLGYAWGSEVVGWINFAPTIAAGVCSPAQEVCIENGGGGLSVNCSVSPSNPNVTDTVTWSVDSVIGGSSPYTYSWSGTDGLSGTSLSVDKIYTAVGEKTGTVTVTDNTTPTPLTGTCSQSVHVCPAGQSWNGISCTVGGGPGSSTAKLIIPDANTNRTKITAQSNTAVIANPPITFQNIDTTGDGAISNIHIFSILPAIGSYDLIGLNPDIQCRFGAAGSWGNCTGPNQVSLASLADGNSSTFAIRIPAYRQEINTNSPYRIKIKGIKADGTDAWLTRPNDTLVDIIFEYLVGGVIPE